MKVEKYSDTNKYREHVADAKQQVHLDADMAQTTTGRMELRTKFSSFGCDLVRLNIN